MTQCYAHPQGSYANEVEWTLEDSDGATAASVRPRARLAQINSWRIRSISCLLSNQGGADDVTHGWCTFAPTMTPALTMTLAPTSAPTTVPDIGELSEPTRHPEHSIGEIVIVWLGLAVRARVG